MPKHPTMAAKTLTTVMTLTLLAVTASAQARVSSLTEPQQSILEAIAEDPAPDSLIRGNHYLISNEDRPHLFYNVLVHRGGTLVGVGTDQLWVYAGWARSEILVPMDFDEAVVVLHRIYMLLFTKAATPEAFLQLWHKRNAKTVRGWLKAHEPDPKRLERLNHVFRIGRQLVYARLKRMTLRYRRTDTPTFMTDQVQYDHLVSMVVGGRVWPVRGDLTKRGCLLSIGRAFERLGHKLDLLYLSNAEQYFGFDDTFRENFYSLPVDTRSLVLRTTPLNDQHYRYEVQKTLDFQAWLRRPKTRSIKQIRRKRKRGWKKDAYVFPAPPSAAP